MKCVRQQVATLSRARSLTLFVLTGFILAAGVALPALAQTESASKAEPAVTHNTWTSGTAMPTARWSGATGAIGKLIYVVGGATGTAVTGVNEIYNPKTKKWTSGAAMPTPRFAVASAVVGDILYAIGGSDNGSDALTVVEAYNSVTDSWSTLTSMPTAETACLPWLTKA